jgi:hypothetical protein
MTRRLTVGMVLFGASALALLSLPRPEPVAAMQKGAAAMQQQILQLQQANANLQQQNTQLQQQIKQLQSAADKTSKDDKTKDGKSKDLQTALDGFKNAGLVHVVILKLKSDSSDSEPQSLIDDTYSQLSKIKSVRGVWAGKPSSKGTPDVAKDDYTVALAFVFDDSSGLKQYLDDPVHTKFADKHLKKWEAPIVYDFEPKKKAAP